VRIRKYLIGTLLVGILGVGLLEGNALPEGACRFIQYYQALETPQTEMSLWERATLSLALLSNSPAQPTRQ
jgi:hypothetical protein